MATDKERREAAESVREYGNEYLSFYGPFIGEAIGITCGSDKELWHRLADLIEPAPESSGAAMKCNRDALLDLADRMEGYARFCRESSIQVGNNVVECYASLIREAVNACESDSDAPAAGDREQAATDAHMDGNEAAEGARTPSIEVFQWVKDHGGLCAVRRRVRNADNRLIELCDALDVFVDDAWNDVMAELRKRLMPEGMEWPTVDGKPVVIGERMRSCGIDDCKVVGIDPANSRLTLASDNIEEGKATYFTDFAEDCHRPAPKALDADGAEIREGDTVYEVEGTGHAYKVVGIRVGDYDRDPLTPTVVTCDEGDGTSEHFLPSQLTHERPETDSWELLEEDCSMNTGVYTRERMGIDVKKVPAKESRRIDMMRDLVRRAKKLAERGE